MNVGNLSLEALAEREGRFTFLDPLTTTEYLTRLFQESATLTKDIDDKTLAAAIWYIFGCSLALMECVYSEKVPVNARLECVEALSTLYIDCLDRRCGNGGADPDACLHNSQPLDVAVYMIWDMDVLQLGPPSPPKVDEGRRTLKAELDPIPDASVMAIERVLLGCRTATCRVSALHAIGHGMQLTRWAKSQADPSPNVQMFESRLTSMVDRFLALPSVPEWLEQYAASARKGTVM